VSGATPLLQVEGLTKKFGGFTAVDGVSFSVPQGEILGLLGPNGSGKSTTFNCIAGMLKPTAGSVKLAGEEIAGQTADESCRRGIGRTFQIPRPFRGLSLLENATLAAHFGAGGKIDKAEAERRARDALRLAQLPDDPQATAHGLGDPPGCVHAEIGLDQDVFQVLERAGIELALGEKVGDPRRQRRGGPRQPLGQPPPPAGRSQDKETGMADSCRASFVMVVAGQRSCRAKFRLL